MGWYLPVLVVDERKMKRVGGTSVVVLMKRVAVGRTAGGVEQAVGIRCRQEWCKHRMSREQLVGITGQRGADRWWQGDTDGGAGGLGGMDGTSSGGHRVEEEDQGAVESKGTSSGETEVEWGRGARQGQGGQRQGV